MGIRKSAGIFGAYDLTITRNKDYFDIYPGNILGINAVLGKNASGKTSFMSLIGERIDDRKNRGEIYVRPEKPHDPLEILTTENRNNCEICR